VYTTHIIADNKLTQLDSHEDHNKAIESYLEFAFEGSDEENAAPVLLFHDGQYYATIYLDRPIASHSAIFSVSLRSGHSASYKVTYILNDDQEYERTKIERL